MVVDQTKSLATMQWGSGVRNILLVHGLSSHSGTWWRIAPILASLGCSVTAVDLRGHGASPPADRYAIDEVAADVSELQQHWDLIVGHSLGGPVAALAAIRGGGDRLLLLDPLFEIEDADFEAVLIDQLAELNLGNPESIQERHPRWHAEDCRQKAIAVGMTSTAVIEGFLRHNHPFHFGDILEQCAVKTLILGSDPADGTLFPPESMRRVYNPRIQYRMVSGCGHSIQREHPEHVISAARELLFSNPGL